MVDIFAKIPFEDVEILDKLVKLGFNAEMFLKRMEVQFEDAEEVERFLPYLPEKAFFLFKAYESGGGKTNTGFAQIICTPEGKPMKPRYVKKSGHLANSTHAMFECSEAVLVTSTKNGTISITYGKIMGNTGEFKSKVLWSGPKEWLPETYQNFEKAVEAAYKKANCYHCRHCHYRR